MPHHGQWATIPVLQNDIVIMDQSVRVIHLNWISFYSSMHSLEVFVTPEKLAFVLQKRASILHLSAMLPETLDCRSAPYAIPCHTLWER